MHVFLCPVSLSIAGSEGLKLKFKHYVVVLAYLVMCTFVGSYLVLLLL